jgi:hypothetical protein
VITPVLDAVEPAADRRDPVADDIPARNVAHPPIGCDTETIAGFAGSCTGVAVGLLQNRASTGMSEHLPRRRVR